MVAQTSLLFAAQRDEMFPKNKLRSNTLKTWQSSVFLSHFWWPPYTGNNQPDDRLPGRMPAYENILRCFQNLNPRLTQVFLLNASDSFVVGAICPSTFHFVNNRLPTKLRCTCQNSRILLNLQKPFYYWQRHKLSACCDPGFKSFRICFPWNAQLWQIKIGKCFSIAFAFVKNEQLSSAWAPSSTRNSTRHYQ